MNSGPLDSQNDTLATEQKTCSTYICNTSLKELMTQMLFYNYQRHKEQFNSIFMKKSSLETLVVGLFITTYLRDHRIFHFQVCPLLTHYLTTVVLCSVDQVAPLVTHISVFLYPALALTLLFWLSSLMAF